MAKGVQAGERLARRGPQALGDEPPPGSLDRERRASVAACGGLEQDLRDERLLDITPAEAEAGLDGGEDDQAFTAGPAQEPGRAAADDLPASALGQAATIRPDRRVPRPPVGEVTRLGKERPNVATRREKLSLCFDSHRPMIVTVS